MILVRFKFIPHFCMYIS